MKKIYLLVLSAILLAVPGQTVKAGDIFGFGVKGGLNFTNMSGLQDFKQEGFLKTYTGFNAGLVFNLNLPLGFEVQPELLYQQSGCNMSTEILGSSFKSHLTSGYLKVPVNVIWGIELFNLIKPYVFVSPYVGVGLFSNVSADGNLPAGIDWNFDESISDNMQRMQYGVGVGAGIKIWKVQVSFKWNWDLNPVFKANSDLDDLNEIFNDRAKDMKFNGGELSVAFIF